MRDCLNVTMRERLPDLLHEALPADARAEVERHLEVCADCRAELEILRHVRAVSRGPRIDVARIVAALPAYHSARTKDRGVRWYAWRAAAAIVLLAGSAVLALRIAQRDDHSNRAPIVAATPIAAPSVAKPATPARTPESTPKTAPSLATVKGNELGVGEGLHDLTDKELRALLADLESLEAVTPTETEVVPPAVERRGS